MSFNAGSIKADLALGRSSWVKDFKKTIAEVERLEGKTITVSIDADADNFFVQTDNVESWIEELDKQSASIDIDANVAEARADLELIEQALDRLDGRRITVDVDINQSMVMAEIAEIGAEMEAWERASDWDIDVSVTPESYVEIENFMVMVEAMDDFSSIDIDVDVDGTAEALAELEALEAKANDLDHKHIDLDVDRLSDLFEDDGGGGRLGLLRILIIGLIALSPVLGVAIGAAGAAIIGFVGALVAAAGPLLILVGGIALLIKEYKDAIKAGDELVGPMKDFADSIDAVQEALDKVIPKISDAGFNLMADALNVVADILPTLVPLFNATADMVDKVVLAIGDFVDSPAYDEMIQFFTGFGVKMLEDFIDILGNLGAFFGRLFSAMRPFIRQMMRGIKDLTGSWAEWAADLENNDAFQHWLDNAAEYGPRVLDMLGSLLDALMAIGHALEPFAGPMLDALIWFFDLIANMDTSTLTLLIGILGALWAGMTFVLPIITSLVSVVSALGAVIGFLISPVGLVILAIVGLIAMMVYLYKTNEEFRDLVNSTWASIRDTILPIIQSIVAYVQENWPAIKEATLDVFHKIEDIIVDVMTIVSVSIKGALALIRIIWKNWGDDIAAFTTHYFKLIWGLISGYLDIIGGIIKVFKGLVTGDWREMVAGLKQIMDGAKTMLESAWNAIKSALGAIVSGIAGDIVDKFRGAINTIIDLWNGISFSFPGVDPPGPGKIAGFTISTPNLPHVAKGGLAFKDTLAIVGDNPGPEPEVIQPLSDLESLLDRRGGTAGIDYTALATAIAVALTQALSQSGLLQGGGVSPEDLERLIRAASVQVSVDASGAGDSVTDWISELMFQFRVLGYGGTAAIGGY